MEKRVLLTGITGFVGSHFFEHLMKTTDWTVVGFHRSSIAGDLNRLGEMLDANPEWEQRLKLIRHDLRDSIHELIDKRIGKVDYVLHLGASSHVDRSIDHPLDFFDDNLGGTLTILEWLRKKPATERPLLNYFSTDEVYGPAPEGTFFTENDAHRPNNPYAAAKAAAEDACEAYHNTYRMPIIISNSMNIIGERQHPEKYLPLVIGKVLKGEKLYIHADATLTQPGKRHYLHARNICAAVVYMLEHGYTGGHFCDRYNVVGDEELDNLEFAKLITEYVNDWRQWNDDSAAAPLELNYELVDFHSSRPGHDLRYGIDGSKIKKLGFHYPVSFRDSLKKTVFWTLDHQKDWLLL